MSGEVTFVICLMIYRDGRNGYVHGYQQGRQCTVTYVNKCPTRCNYIQFILSVNCFICVGWFLHPSSGAQITVSTASGTSHPLLLSVVIVEDLTGSNNG